MMSFTTKKSTTLGLAALLSLGLAGAACSHADEGNQPGAGTGNTGGGVVKGGGNGKADASAEAVFLDFEFDGELLASSTWDKEKTIEDQLLYTVGELNQEDSVGRLDKLELSDIEVTDEGDKSRISYHAELLVAWGEKDDVPESYTFDLPLDMTREGQQSYVENYVEDCVSFSAHDVDHNSMWYYYRPDRSRCSIADEDVVRAEATVSVSEVNTTGKYPEYHKVWEDDVLKVVAVFGKYKDGATSNSDAGIAAYNEFVEDIRGELGSRDLQTEPADVPSTPGVDVPDITFTAQLDGGRSIEVHALMVDNVRTTTDAFDREYEKLSRTADLIAYNGHAGLGSNIRALARKGDWQQGQYAMVFMNGCDTYAYVDTALADAHAAVNPDDEVGTKYVDLVMNAMPAYFRNMSENTMALIRGLMSYEQPRTYERMFEDISSRHIVLVSGEQDNEYVPGMEDDDGNGDVDGEWSGLSESGSLARGEETRYATPKLPAGTYRVGLSGTGDADLYVRAGQEATLENWDCRPYRYGSNEVCEVELGSPTSLHVMVRGWADNSDFEVTAEPMEN